MDTLTTLLSSWHCWRGDYQYARGYARSRNLWFDSDADDEQAERCRIIEREIDTLPHLEQMVLAELARSEFLGITCWQNPRLPRTEPERTRLEMSALGHLKKRLLAAGVLEEQNAFPAG